MEVKVTVTAENLTTGETKVTNEAYLVFCSLDRFGKPIPVPGLLLETEDERLEWKKAQERRALRMRRKND